MNTHKLLVSSLRALAGAFVSLSLAAALHAQTSIDTTGTTDGGGTDTQRTVVSGVSTITLTNGATYTYTNFVTTAQGGVFFANNGANLTFAADPGSLFIFANNKAGSGGAIGVGTTAATTLSITNALFMSNTGAYAGAIFSSSAATTINLTNVSFLNNISTTAVASNFNGGGAIWLGIGNLNLNVTEGNSAVYAGNKAGGVSNGIHFTNYNGNPKLNVNVEAGASLDMLDPMTSLLGTNASTSLTITQTGDGVWSLGGANALNGNNATSGCVIFNVTSGTLHLYRVNESVLAPDGNTYKAAAGSLGLAPTSTLANKSSFTLGTTAGAPATLSIGGGNSISSNGSINLLAGSTLAFDIAGAAAEGLSSATSLLTLTAPTYNILDGTGSLLNSTINFESWTVGNFNLLTAGTQLAGLDPTAFTYTFAGDPANPDNWTFTPTIDSNNSLWVQFAYDGPMANNILTWVGAGPNWLNDANWSSATVDTFAQKDVVNFDGSPTANTTVNLTDTATAGGMFMSGALSYTITGAGITTDNTNDTSAPTASSANGKLTLGATGAADAIDTTTAFTGTLTLDNAANNFTNGIDIYSGALRISNTGQLGTTLSKVKFLGDPAGEKASLQIAAGQTVTFDSDGGATNHLSLSAGAAGDFVVEDGATLTFTNNLNTTVNSALTGGGAITLTGTNTSLTITAGAGAQVAFTNNNATPLTAGSTGDGGAIGVYLGATLTLTGTANGGAFLFDSNTSTGRGGAIFAYTNATVNIDNATFKNNATTGNSNGPTIVALQNSTLNLTNVLFTSNSNAGGAIGGAIFNNTGVQTVVTSATFEYNQAGLGGAVGIQTNAANPASVTLNDVTFLANSATGNGGAFLASNAGALTINLNVSANNTSLIADNMANSVADTPTPNSFSFTGTGPSSASTLNVGVDTNGSLDMLDPMAGIALPAAGAITITKNGAGAWNLGGANTFASTAAATTLTVAQGALHLYRDGETDTTGAHTAAAGKLTIAGAASAFTVNSGATLSVGGGNSITTDGAINLNAGSILSFDLAGYDLAAAPTLLTLTAPTLAITSGANTFNFGLSLVNLTDSGSYNLLSANFSSIADIDASAALAFFGGDPAGLGAYTYTTGITDNILWIDLVAAAALDRPGAPDENHILDWNGAGGSWAGANWTIGDTTGYAFLAGDVINITGSDVPEGVTNATINLSETGTLGGLYVSGSLSIAFKGPGIVADATASNYDVESAAAGKLILGAYYDELETLAFTGTLDLSGLVSNTFAGIEINSGALRVSTNDNLGIQTLSQLSFTGADGALIIADNGNVAFDDNYDGNNKLYIGGKIADGALLSLADFPVVSTTILAQAGASFSMSRVTSSPTDIWTGTFTNFDNQAVAWSNGEGGAIAVAPNATLVLHGENGGGFLFESNTATLRGGAIFVNMDAAVIIDSATFRYNSTGTGSQNGGAIATGWGGAVANNTVASSGTVIVRDSVFEGNYAAQNGGAISGQMGVIDVTNVLFTSNTTVGLGGAIFNNTAGGTIAVRSSTFTGNYVSGAAAANGGGGLGLNGNVVTSVEDSLFTSNSTAGFGGAVMVNGNYVSGTFTNVSFLDNHAGGNGGAIAFNTAQNSVITLKTTTGTSYFYGNTAGAANNPNSIYIIDTSGTNVTTVNISTETGSVLDMLDPISGTCGANEAIAFAKDGGGVWKLAGDNTFNTQGALATGFSPYKASVIINEGELYLYRKGEDSASLNGPAFSAGNIIMQGNNATAGGGQLFSLAGSATLGIGGGNTIKSTQSGNPAGTITLADNSTLAFDVGGFFADTANSAATMLTLTAGSITATWGNINLDLLGLDTLSTDANATYNLLTVNNNFFAGTPAFANDPFAAYTDLAEGYSFKFANSGSTLQLVYAIPGQYVNSVLTWAGNTGADGSSWSADTNWTALDPDTLARTGTNFNPGDIINLSDDSVTATPAIDAPASATLNVDTTTTATIAGMYLSGTTNYTITGTSIVALPAIGTLADSAAATGKLILGALAADDASDTGIAEDSDSPSAYTGTLTLDNASNNFTGGIFVNIPNASLIGNDKTLGAGTVGIYVVGDADVTFNQVDDGVYAAPLTGKGNIHKTGNASLTLTGANSAFEGDTSVEAGSLFLGSALGGYVGVGDTALLGNSNNSAAVGGNVWIADGGTLVAGETGAASRQTFAIGGTLDLDAGATLRYNIFGSGTSDLITAGDLVIYGSGTIDISNPASGTYTLIAADNSFAADTDTVANASAFTVTQHGAALTGRVDAFAFADATATQLLLEVDVTNTTNLWTNATGNNLWSTAAANWTNSEDSNFFNGDSVTFSPAAAATITVDANGVTAAGMTVATAADLTFEGGAITTSTLGTSLTDPAFATGKLVKQGSGALTLANAANTFEEGIDLEGGSLTGNADTLATTRNGINTSADTTLTFLQATDATYAADITGAGNFVKDGSGNLKLTGLTTFGGTTTVSLGTLTLGAADQIANSSAVTIAANATLDATAGAQTLNQLSGAGNLAAGSGALTLNNSAAATTFSGVISGAADITKLGANPLTLAGNNTFAGSLTASQGTLILDYAAGASPLPQTAAVTIATGAALQAVNITAPATLANTFAGNGDFVINSTSTITLTADSSGFAGNTFVMGALNLNGAKFGGATSAIMLDTGANPASLSGNGVIGGNVYASANNTITPHDTGAPVTTTSTLTIGGTLFLGNGSTLNYAFANNQTDLLKVGALNTTGNGAMNLAPNAASGTYTLITSDAPIATTATTYITTLNGNPLVSGRTEAAYELDATQKNLLLALEMVNVPNLVWDGTAAGGIWADNTANWKTNDIFLNGDSVIFDNTAAGTHTVAVDTAGVTARAMAVNTGSYTYTGGKITTTATAASSLAAGVGDGKLTLAADPTVNVTFANTANNFEGGIDIGAGAKLTGNTDTLHVGAAAGIANAGSLIFDQVTSATYTNAITGLGSLAKTGAGTLTLDNAANTYTGGITVLAGALDLTSPSDIGAVSISTGAALNLANPAAIGAAAINGALAITTASDITIANAVTGNGLLSIDAAGKAVTATLATPSAFTGTVALANSTYALSGNNANLAAAATLSLGSGNVTTVGASTQTTGNLAINGAKLDFTSAGIISTGNLTLGTGTIQVTVPVTPAPGATGTSIFAQASGSALAQLVKATGNVTGGISGLTLVDQTGAAVGPTANAPIVQGGVTVATGAYSYGLDATGGLNVKYGLASLAIETGQTLALAPAAGDTGALNILISGNGNLSIDATVAPVTLGYANTFTGTTTVTAGTLAAGVNNALGAAGNALVLAGASTFDLAGKTQTLATVTAAAASTLKLDGALTLSNGGAIDGALTGAGALNLTGGNLAVTKANAAFNGPTTINTGATATLADLAALGSSAISNAGTLNLANTAAGAFTNAVTGNGALNFNGAGVTTLNNASAFAGAVGVNGPVTAANLNALGTGPVTVGSAGALTYTVTGAITSNIGGAGALNLNGTGADTTLSGNNTIATINAAAGSSIVAASPNALGNGSTALTMSAGSRLSFATPAITLGSLAGNGTLAFRVNAAAGTGDSLTIGSGGSTGSFTVDVANDQAAGAPAGELTTITLIKTPGSAAFTLGAVTGTTFAGAMNAYDFSLAPVGGDLALNITRGEALGPTGGAIAANASSVMPLTWFAELDTLSKRLGDLHIAPREKPGLDLWLRAYTQRINVNDKDTLVAFNETQYGSEVGADFGGHPTGYGAAIYIGGFLGYGSSTRDIDDMNNNSGDTTSYHAGAYVTIINPDGWYVDVVGKYNKFKNKFSATSDIGAMNADYNTNAFGASVEAGKRIELRDGWSVTPSAQAAVARIAESNYATRTGDPRADLAINQGQTTTQQLRAGAQLGYKLVTKDAQIIQPYAKLYAAQQWTSGGVITVRGLQSGLYDLHGPYYTTIKGGRIDAGVGVNWQVMKSLQIYFDYETAWAKDYTKPYGLTLGANYAW